jgi:hypothetical protein
MQLSESIAYTVAAVEASALELGISPLDAAIVERVAEYGMEALIECTLAAEPALVVDANVRGVIYARAIERIAQAVAEHCALAAATY